MMTSSTKIPWLLVVLLFLVFGTSVKGGRKAELFLQEPFIRGEPINSYGIEQGPDKSFFGRVVGASKVLFGHYSSLLERRVKAVSSKLRGSVSGLRGRSIDIMQKNETESYSQTMSQILVAYRKSYVSSIKQAIDNTLAPMNTKYGEQYDQCMDTLNKCSYIPELHLKCGVHCLGSAHPVISGLTDLVTSIVEKFCTPLHTIFQKLFEFKGSNFRQFKRYYLFIKLLQEGKKGLVEVSRIAADSVLPLLVENVRTDLMPMRRLIASLDAALKEVEAPIEDITSNRKCLAINDMPAMGQLVNVLYTDPTLVDVILGGQSLISSVAKYIPGKIQIPFAAAAEAVRMMTGHICGLVSYAEDGQAPDCDQWGGFPAPGVPLPSIPGITDPNPECMETDATTVTLVDQTGTGGGVGEGTKPDEAAETAGTDKASPSRRKRSEGLLHSPVGEEIGIDGIHLAGRNLMSYNANGNNRGLRRKRQTQTLRAGRK